MRWVWFLGLCACSLAVEDALEAPPRLVVGDASSDAAPDAAPDAGGDAAADAADPMIPPDASPDSVCVDACTRLVECVGDADGCAGLTGTGAPFGVGRCLALCTNSPEDFTDVDRPNCNEARVNAGEVLIVRLCSAERPCDTFCVDRGQGVPMVECAGAAPTETTAGCVGACEASWSGGFWRCVGERSLPGFDDDPNAVACAALGACIE